MTRVERSRTKHQEGDSVVSEIVSAVAAREGIDPIDLRPPLYTVVDTDSLETLFRDAEPSVAVTFGYRDWEITIPRDGPIRVERPADE